MRTIRASETRTIGAEEETERTPAVVGLPSSHLTQVDFLVAVGSDLVFERSAKDGLVGLIGRITHRIIYFREVVKISLFP